MEGERETKEQGCYRVSRYRNACAELMHTLAANPRILAALTVNGFLGTVLSDLLWARAVCSTPTHTHTRACTHTNAHAHAHARAHARANARAHTNAITHTHTRSHARAHTHTSKRTRTRDLIHTNETHSCG